MVYEIRDEVGSTMTADAASDDDVRAVADYWVRGGHYDRTCDVSLTITRTWVPEDSTEEYRTFPHTVHVAV